MTNEEIIKKIVEVDDQTDFDDEENITVIRTTAFNDAMDAARKDEAIAVLEWVKRVAGIAEMPNSMEWFTYKDEITKSSEQLYEQYSKSK